MFAASALAEVADSDSVAQYAAEALRLAFEETRTPLLLSQVDEAHRAIVATLAKGNYSNVPFGGFGLPGSARDRLRWLGLAPKTVLEREFDGVPLWQILKEAQGGGSAEERSQRRGAVMAELDARVQGAERLEALVLLANDAHQLLHVVEAPDLSARQSNSWVRPRPSGRARSCPS